MRSKTFTASAPRVVEARAWIKSGTWMGQGGFTDASSTLPYDDNECITFYGGVVGGQRKYASRSRHSGSWTDYPGQVSVSNDWHLYKVEWKNANQVKYYVDRSLHETHYNPYISTGSLYVTFGVGVAGVTLWIDWVFVRKFCDPEPSHGAWISLDDTTYLHGKHSWRVSGSSDEDLEVEQALSNEVVEYIRNRKTDQKRGVAFSFWYKPDGVIDSGGDKGKKNKAYAEIAYKAGGTWQTPISGDPVKPDNATKWWHGLVYAQLPTNTEEVKVRIMGTYYSATGEGFKAWIDRALLSVYYYGSVNDPTYGNVTLTTNIYYSNALPIPEFDGFVSASAGIFAEAKDQYSVKKIKELKIELLPNNGTHTTQKARLLVLYLDQSNNRGISIDPEAQEQLVNAMIQTEHLVTSIGFQIVVFGVSVVTGGAAGILIESIGLVVGAAYELSPVTYVDLYHPLAEGGSSYKVWEELDYTSKLGSSYDNRIHWVTAKNYFDWRFITTTDDIFAIKVSAVVEWAHWTGSSWTSAGESNISLVIAISNYWQ